MGPDLSPVRSFLLPRILIAERHFSSVEPLITAIGDRRLNADFDVCTSQRSAVRKLLASPYQLIISGVHLAEIDDFLLLKRTQALEPFVPLLVTAAAQDKESARQVLQQGAFDLIPTPPEHEQTVNTIRVALWHNKFKALLAVREQALEKYRQHIADYPDEMKVDQAFQRARSVVQKTVSSVDYSVQLIEESIVCFSDFATRLEYQARKRALGRLNRLRK
jgi:DNA-binding NtrC family response regulator